MTDGDLTTSRRTAPADGTTSGDRASDAVGALDEPRVSTLELFFDLVFVFAFTQITTSIAADTEWHTLGRGVLIFAVLWWAWGAYAWLTNVVRTEETAPRLVMLGAMSAMLAVALAVPQAFGDGGLAFGLGWLVVMMLHSVLFALSAEPENRASSRRAILRLAPSNLAAAVLLVGAGAADGRWQLALWVAAIVTAYVGPYVAGVAGFTVHPGHFAERHGLIVIIALGESIVAIGTGSSDLAITGSLVGAALLAIVLVSGLWWAYFDVEARRTEAVLTAATGHERARLARDIYSYLHIPLVLGVVLAALGLKKTLEHAGDPLDAVVAFALAGGTALFFAALVAIRLRRGSRPGAASIAAVVVAVAMVPLAAEIAAAASVAVLATVTLGVAIIDRHAPRSAA